MTGQPLFFNTKRQPPVPKTLNRTCSQDALIWLGTILSVADICVCIAWYLMGNDANTFPVPIMIVSALLLFNSRFVADYVQSRNSTWPCYIHMVLQYFLVFSTLWISIAAYISLPASAESVEENWVVAANTVLIPFTTLLDQKGYISTFGQAAFVVGLLLSLASFEPLSEAWASVGGTVRLVEGRYAIIIPEFLVLLAAAVLTLYHDEQGATIGVFALPHSTAAIVWQSACAGLVIIALLALTVGAGKWGSTIGFHFLAVLIFLPLAVITLVTACVTLERSKGITAYVDSNWNTGANIQQFVGPTYSALPSDKYATAAYAPIASAGATGIMLSLFLWFGVILHLRCTAILYHVGPELYILATTGDDNSISLTNNASGVAGGDAAVVGLSSSMSPPSAPPATAASASTAIVRPNPLRSYGATASTNSLAGSSTGDHNKNDAVIVGSPQGGISLAPLRPSTPTNNNLDSPSNPSNREVPLLLNTGRMSVSVSSPGSASPSLASMLKGNGGSAGSYQGIPGSDYEPVPIEDGSSSSSALPGMIGGDSADGDGSGGIGSRSASSSSNLPPGMRFPIHRAASRSVADLSTMIGKDLPADTDTSTFKAAMAAATKAYAEYLNAHGVSVLPLKKTWREKELAAKVTAPPFSSLWYAWLRDCAYMWAQAKCCILATSVLAIVLIVGMSVGLGRLSAVGTCGVLARQPVAVTYTTWFTVAPQHNVYVTNSYPYGSIDIEATHVSGIFTPANHNFTLSVTYYAASADELPSFSAFMASVNTTQRQGGDDDPEAFDFSHVTLTPPPAATTASDGSTSKCVGAVMKIVTNARQMIYSVSSDSALVTVNGDLLDLAGPNLAAAFPTFQELNITTNTAPAVLNNVWVEGVDGTPPSKEDPNFSLRPHLNIASNTGAVTLKGVTAPGVNVATGGSIRTSTLASSLVHYCGAAVCGDVSLVSKGTGKIVISQLLGGYNINLQTDQGMIVVANAGILLGGTMNIASNAGKIILNDFLQATGNATFVTTHNADVSMSAVVANQLFVNTDGAGKVSMVEGFFGIATPASGSSSLVIPYSSATGNYSLPRLNIRTDRGDIVLDGVGNSPSNGAYADVLSLDLQSNLGDVKVEVNGGGVNANYTLVSDRGREIVEIDGQSTSSTHGVLGTGGKGQNYVYLYSEGGDVQLMQLPSPY